MAVYIVDSNLCSTLTIKTKLYDRSFAILASFYSSIRMKYADRTFFEE